MSSHLLLAPAAHGKTHYAVEKIRGVLASEPLAQITVILPNQNRVAEFRRRLAAAGGVLGVNLGTFRTLYAEILKRAGQPRARLLDPVQIRLLRSIVDRLCQEDRLRHYAPLQTKPGFISALREIIQELKRARIEPVDFSFAVANLQEMPDSQRLEEIAAIYTEYQEWLLRKDWADPEGQGWLAAIALDSDPKLESGLRLLVVNGFDEFNPTQLGVLTLLAQRAEETLITLTGDPDHPSRSAHRRFQRAQQALTAALDLQPTSLAPSPLATTNPALTHLESCLFEPTSGFHNPKPELSKVEASAFIIPNFIEAQNRASEARAALRWAKARIVRDGMELSEVAILARSLAPYRPFLEETSVEFGIPLRITGGMPLAENPAVAALLSLLSIPALDWPRAPVLKAWRSPYFDWSAEGITPGDCATLDTVTRLGRVTAGLDQWNEAFTLFTQQNPPDDLFADKEGHSSALPEGERSGVRGEIHPKFNQFVTRISPASYGAIRDYAGYIEDLIGDDPVPTTHFTSHEDDTSLHIVARTSENPATTERDVTALRAFKDVLRGLVLAESVLSTGSLEYAAFFNELRRAVEAATYTVTPQTGVFTASALDARGLSFRAVAILGLSEGEFPQVEREDPFLRESDRGALREQGLPIESKLHGDEPAFFYQAVTRARECLYLSRPYLADDGQAWEPSPYWLHIWRMFGEPKPQRVRPESPPPPEDAASQVEFVQAIGEINADLQRKIAVLQSRLNDQALGPHEGLIPELSTLLLARYGAAFGWSASKLESYGTCPFYFYIAYALELEPRTPPEEGYDVRILGSMLHQILEFTYRRATDPTDLEECLSQMPKVAREVFNAAPADYGFRPTPLWHMQQEELERILRETIIALAEVSEGYTPRHFEPRFGMGNPSLILRTEIGDIRLHGYIDRVDEGADGELRIMDYKAGSTPINARQLEEGHRLQLPIYALAARDALGLGEIASGFYWHIGTAKASILKLERYKGGVEAAFDTAVKHVTNHVRNIHSGNFQPQSPKGGCPFYCPAVGFCWRYRSKRW